MPLQFILASGSPRRRELLGMLGLDFEVVVPLVDETPRAGESPLELVSRLAPAKAVEVRGRAADLRRGSTDSGPSVDPVVIAADTVVDHSGRIFGTPQSLREAREMLVALSDGAHLVHTGVAVITAARELFCVVTTEVVFDRLSETTIDWYLSTGESLDKAGAYGLQGVGGSLVREVHGSVSNVIGLPLVELRQLLEQVSVEPGG
jgi:septum formation protein